MAKEVKMKKKRERKKINAFDVVIILLILCLIATFAYKIYDGVADPTMKKDAKYTLTFKCDDEYISLAKYLEDGEAVYFEKNGELLGNLYKDSANAQLITVTGVSEGESGNYDKAILSGKLKLNANAVSVGSGNYYTVGDINVAVGSEINVYTEDTVFTLKVVSISEIQ